MSELDRAYYDKTPAKTKDDLELHIARIMCCRDECTKAHPLSEMELGGEGGCNMLRFAFDAGRVLDGIGAAGWAVVPAILTKNMDYDFLRAENARLRGLMRDAVDLWDWWQEDTCDRALSGDAFDEMRAALEVKP